MPADRRLFPIRGQKTVNNFPKKILFPLSCCREQYLTDHEVRLFFPRCPQEKMTESRSTHRDDVVSCTRERLIKTADQSGIQNANFISSRPVQDKSGYDPGQCWPDTGHSHIVYCCRQDHGPGYSQAMGDHYKMNEQSSDLLQTHFRTI